MLRRRLIEVGGMTFIYKVHDEEETYDHPDRTRTFLAAAQAYRGLSLIDK